MQASLKVGALVLAFVGCFLGAYVVLGRSVFAVQTERYTIVFPDAGGVVSGAPVMFRGVRVGQVNKVRLDGSAKALIDIDLEKGTPVPVGTTGVIANSLIGIGDRPLQLEPPTTDAGVLPPGSILEGKTQSPLESLSPESRETLQALNSTLKATQSLLQDQKLRGRVEDLLVSSNQTVKEFGILAGQINRVVASNQASVQSALRKASSMMDDLSVATQTVARLAGDGKLEAKMTGLLDEMNATIRQSNALVADLRKTVNDPELQGPVKEILANSKTMSDSGVRIAANAETMTQNGVTLSAKAIEIAEKASKLADELSSVLKKFDEALGKVAGITQPGRSLFDIETTATITRETDPGRFRSDFEAKIPTGKDSLYLGMYDAFEGNKLIAQFGRTIDSRTQIRYGVYASKPGVGVEYQIAPGTLLRGDLFDVNQPRLDVRARFDFNRNVSGWLGIEKVFDRTKPSVGVSIRR